MGKTQTLTCYILLNFNSKYLQEIITILKLEELYYPILSVLPCSIKILKLC